MNQEITIEAHVRGYVPRHVPWQAWEVVAAPVRAAAGHAASTLPTVKVALPSLAAFAEWLWREGYQVELGSLCDLELIERYTQVGMPGKSEATRATRRATLRRAAARINPTQVPPPEAIAYRRARAPYTPAEIAGFFAVAQAQPTRARRRSMTSILALGLGAGLHRQDLAWVTGSDVVRDGDAVVVTVSGGPRPRTVPVLDCYAEAVRDCARRAGPDDLLIGGMFPGRRNVTGPTLDRMISDRSVPRVVPTRLRSTWLVSHLNLRTPYAILLPAAGLESSRTLDDLLEYADPIAAPEAINLLRGTSNPAIGGGG